MNADDSLPDDIATLKRLVRAQSAELARARAEASSAEALIAHLRLAIEKLKRELYGRRSERKARLLEQMELQLEELEASAAEDAIAADQVINEETGSRSAVAGRKSSRRPLPAHLPRERVVVPGPSSCASCGSTRLAKLGEDVTETLEVIPRQWKVIQTVREKFTCRACEKISQPPAPFHIVPRGLAGPSLLAMVLFEKYGQHQPLNRQAERYAREGVPISLSTLADQVGTCAALLRPLCDLIRDHVFAGERVHGDDTPVPVLAKGKTATGRAWVYVRDDRPFGGRDPPAAVFFYSRDRSGDHPERHLGGYGGILQADAYAGFNRLYEPARRPAPLIEAACWSHARRKFFVLADVTARARSKLPVRAPLALEAVKRIDAIFAIERDINGVSARSPLSGAKLRLSASLSAWFEPSRSSPSSRPGCARNGRGCRGTPRSPRRWIACSSAGRPSRASSMTAGSASATTPPSGRCAALHWDASRGSSPAPIAAASARRSSTP